MNNKMMVHIAFGVSLAAAAVYKVLVREEPWAIGMSQVISLWIFLTAGYIAVLNFEKLRSVAVRFFTEADSPVNLAFFRIIFFGYLLFPLDDPELIWFSQLPKDLQFAPMGMGWLLPHLPINATLAMTGLILFKAACFLAIIGYSTRLATVTAAVTAFYIFGIPQFYGNVSHDHHVFWFLVIFAASRCADVLSVDAVIKGFKKADRNQSMAVPPESREYALPLRFMWILLGICYFFPGFWKLWNSGTAWIFGDNMRNHMYVDWFGFDCWLPPIRVDQWPWFCRLSGASVIVFEISYVFLIFFRKTRYVAMFWGLLFHNMTNLLMNINFYVLQMCYASLPNWDAVFRWMGKKFIPEPLVVLYDGSCSFCRRAIALLHAFDVLKRIEYSDLHSAASQPIRNSLNLSDEQLMHDMHAVAGTNVIKGFAAYRNIASRIPLLWPVFPFLFLGPVHMIGNTIYRKVADHRTCRIPPKKITEIKPQPSYTVLIAIASVLIMGNLFMGFIGKGSGWPFACYPTFSEIAWDRFRTIDCLVIYNDGTEKVLRIQSLKSKMASYKLGGLIGKIFSINDAEIRNRKFKAVWGMFLLADPDLNRAQKVRFYFLENYTDPAKWHLNPAAKTVAFEFEVNKQ